jgi:hypothetical protein
MISIAGLSSRLGLEVAGLACDEAKADGSAFHRDRFQVKLTCLPVEKSVNFRSSVN